MSRVDDVHRAGATAVDTGLAAEQLREQRIGVGSHREQVAVPAIRARDPVVRPEHAGEADGDCFLPGIEVGRPVDLAAEEETLHPVLEAADEEHPLVELRVKVDVVEGFRLRPVAQAAHATSTLASVASRSAR